MNFPTHSLLHLSPIEWAVLGFFLMICIIQAVFYFALYRKPYLYLKKTKINPEPSLSEASLPSISVVIVSKNEAENVRNHLPKILSQDYPDFEVVVVNMGSTDDTDIELTGLAQSHPNLYHTYVPANAEPINEKKLALTIGIKAAKKEILLLTDADCYPTSNQWIREIAKKFVPGKEIVLGYAALEIDKKISMKRFIEFDNLWLAIRYFSMAIAKRPFMGIGKNLAYRKELFFKNKGFSHILNIESGEDDLFINKIANSSNTAVALSPESIVSSNVIERFATWRSIKSAYAFNQQYYRGCDNFLRNTELFTRYAFYMLLPILIARGVIQAKYLITITACLLFLFRFLFQYKIINRNAQVFQTAPFSFGILFHDIVQPIRNIQFKRYARRKSGKKK